jgi:hypothetical protein
MKLRYIIMVMILLTVSVYKTFSETDSVAWTIKAHDNPGAGYLLLGPWGSKLSLMDNNGHLLYIDLPDTTVRPRINLQQLPNGMLAYFENSAGKFYAIDKSLAIVDSFETVEYRTDFHELKISPNGHIFMLGADEIEVDMSQKVDGGRTDAIIRGFVIQEQDENRNVVWEWRTRDHLDVLDATSDQDLTQKYLNPFHCNSIDVDAQGNVYLNSRHSDEITKINKTTGEIIWRMGGKACKNNQFTFIGDTIDGFWGFSHQHTVTILPNGNILMLDNGNMRSNPFSRAVEYQINESNKTATKVWEYRKNPDVFVPWMGGVNRLPNGNTLIGWGGLNTFESIDSVRDRSLAVTEVRPNGEIAFELELENYYSYRAFRGIFLMDAKTVNVNNNGTYDFSDSKYDTKVKIDVTYFDKAGSLTVEKHNYAPPQQSYTGTKPCILYPYRFVLSKTNIDSLRGTIKIKVSDLNDIQFPENVSIYVRKIEGEGNFVKLETSYSASTKLLSASFTGFGEFIIGASKIETPRFLGIVNNSLGIPVTGKLEWTRIYGKDSYYVQLAHDSLFEYKVIDDNSVMEEFVNFSNLENSSDYYCRIRTITNSGCISNWSAVLHFKTTLARPELEKPMNADNNVPVKDKFSWFRVMGASSYRIQISADTTFTNKIVNVVTYDSYYDATSLNYNTDYFWRVRAISDTVQGDWSSTWSFHTIMKAPALINPKNNITGVAIDGNFIWEALENAELYHIQVSKKKDFSINVISTSVFTNEYQYSGLENSTDYFWRVKAEGVSYQSDWSEIGQFTTIHTAPVLQQPENNALHVPISGYLNWKNGTTNHHYQVQLSTDSTFTATQMDLEGITVGFAEYKNLNENTIYYWRVRSVSDDGKSNWSEIWNFTTLSSVYLAAPILMDPIDGEKKAAINGTISWLMVDGAEKYRVQLSDNPEFKPLIIDSKNLSVNSVNYKSLSFFKNYYWRVNASNKFSTSDWSPISNFMTKIGPPLLLSPASGLRNVPLTSELKWQQVMGAVSYKVQIYDIPIIQRNSVWESDVIDTTMIIENLSSNTKYFWRVSTSSEFSESDWSDVFNFTTIEATSVENEPEENGGISQYPNPVEDMCHFYIRDQKISDISIMIFDILGNKILEFNPVNNTTSGNIISLNTSSLSDGVYIYHINSGPLIKSGTFIKK